MVATSRRRGPIRLISVLPDLVGSASWVEVEQGGAVFRAPPSAFGNSPSIFANTVLQLPLSANFNDVSPLAMTPAVSGSVAISGGVAVFSGAGGEVDYTTGLAFGSSAFDPGLNFTLEGWFKTTVATQFATLFERSFGGGSATFEFLINNGVNDGKLAMYSPDGGPALVTTHGWNDDAWHHTRYVRYGQQNMIWIDGLLEAFSIINPLTNWVIGSSTPRIGASSTPGRAFIGSMHDWRMVKGYPLSMTPKFTVPAFPFPTA